MKIKGWHKRRHTLGQMGSRLEATPTRATPLLQPEQKGSLLCYMEQTPNRRAASMEEATNEIKV